MHRGIAITVRYVGPTNTRGSRWIARADHPEGRAVVSYDYALDAGMDNAKTAADALIAKWNDPRHRSPDGPQWSLLAGGHNHEHGYVFIATYGAK